ncbi:MAG: sigma-70 family RNA polymerase sigma factor, partial [Bacteroidota bacterium]
GNERGEWQDLEQEIILQLWRSYPNFNSSFKPSTWVYRIAFNVAVTHYRLSKKRTRQELTSAMVFLLNTENESPEVVERRQALYAAIRKLGPTDRPIIILHLEGLSYQAIAEVVGISASNVCTRLNRIRAKLKQSVTT